MGREHARCGLGSSEVVPLPRSHHHGLSLSPPTWTCYVCECLCVLVQLCFSLCGVWRLQCCEMDVSQDELLAACDEISGLMRDDWMYGTWIGTLRLAKTLTRLQR